MCENNILKTKTVINCKGNLINLCTPKIMGILNITPDSFYDGNRYSKEKQILERIEQIINDGATWIDIGAVSTRPGAETVSLEEEKKRLLPTLDLINNNFSDILISVDTYRADIAKEAVINHNVCLINDISSGELDANMIKTVAELNVPYVAMHMQGNPTNMQKNPKYNNVIDDIIQYFSKKIPYFLETGINDIIIDPGIGFGKTIEHNFLILNYLKNLKILERPILIGLSRKSMIYKTLKTNPENALCGTITANTIAILNGANIIRVHDVKEAFECIEIINELKLSENYSKD